MQCRRSNASSCLVDLLPAYAHVYVAIVYMHLLLVNNDFVVQFQGLKELPSSSVYHFMPATRFIRIFHVTIKTPVLVICRSLHSMAFFILYYVYYQLLLFLS